jgi:hypothetical protein
VLLILGSSSKFVENAEPLHKQVLDVIKDLDVDDQAAINKAKDNTRETFNFSDKKEFSKILIIRFLLGERSDNGFDPQAQCVGFCIKMQF